MCVNRRLGKGKGRVDTFCHGTAYFCHAAIIVLPAYHYCIKVFFQHAPAQPNQPSSSSPSLSPLSPPSHSHNMTAHIWLRHYPAPPDQDKQEPPRDASIGSICPPNHDTPALLIHPSHPPAPSGARNVHPSRRGLGRGLGIWLGGCRSRCSKVMLSSFQRRHHLVVERRASKCLALKQGYAG